MGDDVRRAAGAALLAAAWLSLIPGGPGARAEQAVRLSEAVGDGALRSELSLVGRTATVAVTPGLKAGGPEHQRVTGAPGDTSRVRIGYLNTNGVLQFGPVSVGKLDPVGVRFDLSLSHASSGWLLVAEPVASSAPASAGAQAPGNTQAPGSAPVPGNATAPANAPAEGAAVAATVSIPLVSKQQGTPGQQGTKSSAGVLTAAWMPVGRDTAQLLISWGDLALSADVQFVEPKMPRPNAARQAPPTKRSHDEPNRGARQLMLSQLNETAVVLPGGQRLSLSFGRSFPRGQRSVSAAATISRAGLGADGPDYARLMTTANGAVVELTEAAVPRLLVGVPLRLGKATLRPGNQTPGYSGAYGLWLKRVAPGWRLVFNSESDVWGTQYDGKFDVADVELQHVEGGDASRPFAIALVPAAVDRGRLTIVWGAHEWSVDYLTAD